jgi:hypothetical protein
VVVGPRNIINVASNEFTVLYIKQIFFPYHTTVAFIPKRPHNGHETYRCHDDMIAKKRIHDYPLRPGQNHERGQSQVL